VVVTNNTSSNIMGLVNMNKPTESQMQFMINAFTKKRDEAIAKGNKELFERMEEQLKWLHNAQRNKYK
jgi:uncharacterized membrane protein (DUF106 family)